MAEKAADLLTPAISVALKQYPECNFLVLGSGEKAIESELINMVPRLKDRFYCSIEYNETLSHRMYAGADFLLMPSRVEPCGLNQLYAMRYGTIPVVRSTGGLKDTVIDYEDEGGFGITFLNSTVDDIVYSIGRSIDLFNDKKKFQAIRNYIMKLNHSWRESVLKYLEVYK